MYIQEVCSHFVVLLDLSAYVWIEDTLCYQMHRHVNVVFVLIDILLRVAALLHLPAALDPAAPHLRRV